MKFLKSDLSKLKPSSHKLQMFDDLQDGTKERLAQRLAEAIGNAFGQSYRYHGGTWWLCQNDRLVRALRQEEIDWHTARKHKPFVLDDIDVGDERWWRDPDKENEDGNNIN